MALKVPETQRDGVRELLRIDDATAERLLVAISESQPTVDEDALSAALADRFHDVTGFEWGKAVNTLVKLYEVRDYFEMSIEEFSEDIFDFMRRNPEEFPELTDSNRLHLLERFKQFLSLDRVLGVTAKASNIINSGEHLFLGARTISDIRPIFGSDVTQAPAAVALVHTLCIHYREAGTHRDIYFTLNEHDVETLAALFGRTQQKTTALRAMISIKDIALLED